MRLLLVTNDYPPKPGGIQQYLGNLIDHIDGEVRVLGPAGGPVAEGRRGESVVRRSRRRFMWPTRAVRRWVVEEVRAFQPDLVLFGAPYPLAWMAPRLKRETSVPVGILCHGAEITVPAIVPVMRTVMKRSLRAADHRFAVSRFTADQVARLAGRPVVYVGAGVDADAFSPRDEQQGRSGPPTVGCVSRFVPRKGQSRLLEAAARLSRRGTRIELLLVGKGRLEGRLRRRARRLGVPVRFAVGVPWSDLPDLYRQMDVFCMPCRTRWGGLEVEGLGIVYLEAAAAALPVLAGSSGGAPETVLPGSTGFVVHSTADIERGIELLVGDRPRADEMGRRGRAFVTVEYSWEAVAARIVTALGGEG